MNYEIFTTFHNKPKIMHILFHMIHLFLLHNTHYVDIHIVRNYSDKIEIIGLDPKYGWHAQKYQTNSSKALGVNRLISHPNIPNL
jgi:hypothetical protein